MTELAGPRHVAIIMDGNGRWAKRRGLSRAEGHRAGVEALHRVVEAARQMHLGHLTVYAFSTENWRRPPHEVDVLMRLLVEYLRREVAELAENGVRLATIGHVEALPDTCQAQLAEALAETAGGRDLVLTLALNYGGRQEIADAARALAERAAKGEIDPQEIDEEVFSRQIRDAGVPDPDLIVRPSGEWRLSNFLLWQAAYAEIYVTPVLWPDFGPEELEAAVASFRSRDRRFGGLGGTGR